MSTLRDHVKALHPQLKMRRAEADLARDHGTAHHRRMPNHYHAGVNTGPDQRPRGWRTGEDAVMRVGNLATPGTIGRSPSDGGWSR